MNAKEMLMHLATFSLWCKEQIEFNGSNKIYSDGSPVFKKYEESTLEVFDQAMLCAKILVVVAGELFLMHEDEIPEFRLYSEIEKSCASVGLPNPFEEEQE